MPFVEIENECTSKNQKYKSDENKIRMAVIEKETLDQCLSIGILMKSMEREETSAPLELEHLVKWALEWMDGPSTVDAPKYDRADTRSSSYPP